MARVRPTHLLHLAWDTTPRVYWTSADNLRWVQTSLDLIQAFVCLGGRRIVFAGTCRVRLVARLLLRAGHSFGTCYALWFLQACDCG